jgi:hypothetical protein
MPTPITQIPKPDVERIKDSRKLFLVPTFLISPDAPENGQQLLERYWSEVRDHVHKLESSLGRISHVFHEALFFEGDEGLKVLEGLNPRGYSFIKAMCQSNARLEATEDRALLEEGSDWRRCVEVGLMSEKVLSTALEGYQKATSGRYEHIGNRIDETLTENETGVLFISEDHRVQFPTDMQVFYVAPPALDALKRWINDQLRSAAQSQQQTQRSGEADAPS